jgi:hypothetical protein
MERMIVTGDNSVHDPGFAVGAHRRIARRVAHGLGNRFAAHDYLTAVRTVLHLERWRTGERLRRCTDGRGLLLETTGLKDRWIVITVRLHPVAQLTQHQKTR